MAHMHLLDLELRHMKASNLAQLSTIIDKTKAWKELLDKLSKPLDLTLEAIHLIELQSQCGKSPTLALLNHWSITGRRRPTIRTLLQYLKLCNLKWAEDYVWREVLGCDESQIRQITAATALKAPGTQTAIGAGQQPISVAWNNTETSNAHDTHDEHDQSNNKFLIEDTYKFADLKDVIAQLHHPCPRYSFKQVYLSTNRFCHRPYDFKTGLGRRIGDGRFSSVFLANTHLEQDDEMPTKNLSCPAEVAAKLLKAECKLNYLVNEINLAMRIKHENILELLGISVGCDNERPAYMCLIYSYMQNGSLLECIGSGLRCNENAQIDSTTRFKMALKIGRGIAYLHTFTGGTIIHRDVKTANILIDKSLNPKLGDFTLVRQLDSMRANNETQYSQNVIGTSVYMPPEAFRGDISSKFDVFSYGIVLFELLSGRRPFDEESCEDLLTYVSEMLSDIEDKFDNETSAQLDTSQLSDFRDQFLADFLDKRAGRWAEFSSARVMFELALQATEVRKRDRPEMTVIVARLESKLGSCRD